MVVNVNLWRQWTSIMSYLVQDWSNCCFIYLPIGLNSRLKDCQNCGTHRKKVRIIQIMLDFRWIAFCKLKMHLPSSVESGVGEMNAAWTGWGVPMVAEGMEAGETLNKLCHIFSPDSSKLNFPTMPASVLTCLCCTRDQTSSKQQRQQHVEALIQGKSETCSENAFPLLPQSLGLLLFCSRKRHWYSEGVSISNNTTAPQGTACGRVIQAGKSNSPPVKTRIQRFKILYCYFSIIQEGKKFFGSGSLTLQQK